MALKLATTTFKNNGHSYSFLLELWRIGIGEQVRPGKEPGVLFFENKRMNLES